MSKGKKKKKKKKDQKIVSSNNIHDKVQTSFSVFVFWSVFTKSMNVFFVLRNHMISVPNNNVLKRLGPA
jgi:hypothetical protein